MRLLKKKNSEKFSLKNFNNNIKLSTLYEEGMIDENDNFIR